MDVCAHRVDILDTLCVCNIVYTARANEDEAMTMAEHQRQIVQKGKKTSLFTLRLWR